MHHSIQQKAKQKEKLVQENASLSLILNRERRNNLLPLAVLSEHTAARWLLCNARGPLGGYHTMGMSKFELSQVYLVFRRLA